MLIYSNGWGRFEYTLQNFCFRCARRQEFFIASGSCAVYDGSGLDCEVMDYRCNKLRPQKRKPHVSHNSPAGRFTLDGSSFE